MHTTTMYGKGNNLDSDRLTTTSAKNIDGLPYPPTCEIGEIKCTIDAQLPGKNTKKNLSYYSVQDGLLFKSDLLGHLKKTSTFYDQLSWYCRKHTMG